MGKLTTREEQVPDTTIFAEFETLSGASEGNIMFNTSGVDLYFG